MSKSCREKSMIKELKAVAMLWARKSSIIANISKQSEISSLRASFWTFPSPPYSKKSRLQSKATYHVENTQCISRVIVREGHHEEKASGQSSTKAKKEFGIWGQWQQGIWVQSNHWKRDIRPTGK